MVRGRRTRRSFLYWMALQTALRQLQSSITASVVGNVGERHEDRVARHEAGHAVAMVRRRLPFRRVFAGGFEPHVHAVDRLEGFEDTDFSAPRTISEARAVTWNEEAQRIVRKLMLTMAAGPLAEMRYHGRGLSRNLKPFVSFGGTSDAGWIDGYALGLSTLIDGDVDDIVARKEQLIEEALEEASSLVRREVDAIERVAVALEGKGELTRDEVIALVSGEYLEG